MFRVISNRRSVLSAFLLLATTNAASAQHIDVLVQTIDNQIVIGAGNYDDNTWLIGQRVFQNRFLSNFRTTDPGFTSLAADNPSLAGAADGFNNGDTLEFDFLPTSLAGTRSNLWYWDGSDPDNNGLTIADVAFTLPPALHTFATLDENSGVSTLAGEDMLVAAGTIQTASSSTVPVHSHLRMQVRDNDGDNTTLPAEGVYLVALQVRANGYETSDPFFFLHSSSNFSSEAQGLAFAWVNENWESLIQMPGDFNGDGSVDAADYTVWRDGLGSEYVAADYLTWKDNFGVTAGSVTAVAAAVSVPEPGTVWLAVIGLISGWLATFWRVR